MSSCIILQVGLVITVTPPQTQTSTECGGITASDLAAISPASSEWLANHRRVGWSWRRSRRRIIMENPNSFFRLRSSGFVRPAQLKLQTNIVYSVKMKTTQIDFWNLEMEISGKAVQCPPRSPTMVTQYSLKAPWVSFLCQSPSSDKRDGLVGTCIRHRNPYQTNNTTHFTAASPKGNKSSEDLLGSCRTTDQPHCRLALGSNGLTRTSIRQEPYFD